MLSHSADAILTHPAWQHQTRSETLHSWEYRLYLLVSNVLSNKAVLSKSHFISSSLPLYFHVSYPFLPNITPPENTSEEHVPFLLLLMNSHSDTRCQQFTVLCSDRSKEDDPVCQAFSFLITVALSTLQPPLSPSAHLCEQRSPSVPCQTFLCRAVGHETHLVFHSHHFLWDKFQGELTSS